MTIPTAEEFAKQWITNLQNNKSEFTTPKLLIEFAQLHVEAALKEVNKACENEIEKDFINKDLIINSYPLTNIK